MKMSVRLAPLAVAAITVGLTACGGGDDSGGGGEAADSPIAKALAADMLADSGDQGDSPVASEEDAQCWAGKIVSGIGEERLAELGVTESNVPDLEEVGFTEAELSTVVDTMFECIDVKAAFASEFEEQFGADGAACLADALDEEFVKEAMSSEFNDAEPSDEFMQQFIDIAAECDLPLN